MLNSVKELIVNVSVCVCRALLYLGQCVSLLRRSLHCWARLVYRKCSKKTVEKVVGPLVSLQSEACSEGGDNDCVCE